MQPAPQRNTTFLSKMTTARHAHTHQASKCSRRHNETPRYDSKWPPRHTRTHARLQNAARTTTGHHVTIENGHRATRKPSIITWCSRFKENIYKFFFREHHVTIEHRATTRAQFCTITCSKCCACHEKNNITCSNAAPATKKSITCSKCCTCHEKKS